MLVCLGASGAKRHPGSADRGGGAARYNTPIMRKRSNPESFDQAADAVEVDENGYTRPSKSQIKREMLALQDLGTELVGLSKDGLRKVPMPEALDAAVREARRTTSHEGRRRQVHYVGKVMRTLDETEVAAIRHALEAMKGASSAETAKMHAIERWREQLLADDGALTEFLRRYPQAEVQAGRTLIRNARREAEQKKPPRYFRELFQWIKDIVSAAHRQEDARSEALEDFEASEDDDDFYKPE